MQIGNTIYTIKSYTVKTETRTAQTAIFKFEF